MASNREAAREIGYPKLDRADLDLIIDQLLFAMRQRNLGTDIGRAETVFAYLTSFYTRRWGLPAVLSRTDQTMST